MVEAILHLFKIHRKMIFGNSSIVVQNMLCKTPKTLNTVDMIPGFFADHGFRVVNGQVLAQPLQRVVTPEGVRIVDRALSGFLSDHCHEFFFGYMLHHPRIHLAIALQKAKNDVFALGATTTLAFASAAKIAFVHLHLAREPLSLKFGNMMNYFSELLVHARDRLVVHTQVVRKAISRLLLVEALDDGDLCSYPLQRLLFSTDFVSASDVPTLCLNHLKRTAKYALLASQKVGRATENVLSTCNHKDILAPSGYETP